MLTVKEIPSNLDLSNVDLLLNGVSNVNMSGAELAKRFPVNPALCKSDITTYLHRKIAEKKEASV